MPISRRVSPRSTAKYPHQATNDSAEELSPDRTIDEDRPHNMSGKLLSSNNKKMAKSLKSGIKASARTLSS